jgi:uncharacterized protein with ParB-like and HNH nuclease domain
MAKKLSVDFDEDYEISLRDGVEDESSREDIEISEFSIRSYGVDYTVDTIVSRMDKDYFIIPDFQRNFVWSQKHASKFIESLLMGLPVPGIFLYKQADNNKHLIIDGQQRLKTLQAYYKGLFREKKFRLVGVMKQWENKTYQELEISDQLKIDDAVIHATVFQQDKPEDVLDSIYYVFERINSGGIRLSSQEIRNCIYDGDFIDLAKDLNKNHDWRVIFGSETPNNRAKDIELIIRFFSLYEFSNEYKRPMVNFLNTSTFKLNNYTKNELYDLKLLFEEVINLVIRSIGNKPFRPVTSLNAAVFDAVMVGLARRIKLKEEKPNPTSIVRTYAELLNDKDFKNTWERATADDENVRKRLELSEKYFMNT